MSGRMPHNKATVQTNSATQSSARVPLREEIQFTGANSLRAHTRLIVAVLCMFASGRVLIFASAFPLFNNIDEPAHFSLIRVYAQGHWPGKDLPHYDRDTGVLLALFASEEYLTPQNDLESTSHGIPLYAVPRDRLGAYLSTMMQRTLAGSNHEGQSPPLYYLMAAGWQLVGVSIGMSLWQIAYWTRFMNALSYAALVWLSYRFLRKAYPERPFLWLAVPALLAIFPQDVYFGMNRDVLSAPFAAAALWFMAEAADEQSSRQWPLIAASFLVGLAFLVNVPNGILYGALALTFWVWIRRQQPVENKWRVVGFALAAALLLPALWMMRNYSLTGDLTGARAKMESLGWALKPHALILHHPLFSSQGLKYFLGQLAVTFWRGEYVWHMERMRWSVADRLYVFSSALMIGVFAIELLRGWRNKRASRFASCQALLLILTSVVFMAVLSLPFDFGVKNSYPSRDLPYFVSGRMIQAALPAFAVVYAAGLETLLGPIRKWAPAVALVMLMIFITASEFNIRRVAFSSRYNFFALLSWNPEQPQALFPASKQNDVTPNYGGSNASPATNSP